MNDDVDTADAAYDPDKHARRERIRGAFTRAKDIFKKERTSEETHAHNDFKLSDDVNDFLAAGRKAAATTTIKSVPDNNSPQNYNVSPRSSAYESVSARQASPRGVPTPRLDLSQSQRYRNARPITDDHASNDDDHLSPEYNAPHRYERSHSFNSALAKKGAKSRGLSVTFVNAPPVIIGEGGDESPFPPCEISKARHQRSRSLSPYVERPLSYGSNSPGGSQSPVRRKPVAPQVTNVEREDSIFQPRPVRRVQTGFNTQQMQPPYVDNDFAAQLNQALKLGGEHGLVKPSADPQHQRDIPPAQPPRPSNNIKPVNATREVMSNQFFPPSPQSIHHPDLQQSRQTSGKPPPPRVPNYYAQIKQESHGRQDGNGQHSSTQGVQRPVVNDRSQSMQDHENGSRNDVWNSQQDLARRTHSTRHQPPEGWL